MKIQKPKQTWQLICQRDWITSVTFLKSSQQIAAGNRLGDIFIWDLPAKAPEVVLTEKEKKQKKSNLPNYAPVKLLKGHTNGITHLIATQNGKTLISSSLDKTIRIWNVDGASTGKENLVLDQTSRERNIRYKSKKEKEKILNTPGISVDVISQIDQLKGHDEWVKALGISADQKRLISGDDFCLSIVWDLTTRKEITRWKGYDRVWVTSAALSPDGKTACTTEYADRRSSFDAPAAQVRLWNANDGKMLSDLLKLWTPKVKDKDRVDSYNYWRKWSKLLKRGFVASTFSPDGKLLALAQGGETSKGQVQIVDVTTGKILRTISNHQGGVCDVKFSSDGNYVVSAGRDTTVKICQVTDGKEIATLGKSRGGQFKDWFHAVAISPDQQFIATADIAGMVHVWKMSN